MNADDADMELNSLSASFYFRPRSGRMHLAVGFSPRCLARRDGAASAALESIAADATRYNNARLRGLRPRL